MIVNPADSYATIKNRFYITPPSIIRGYEINGNIYHITYDQRGEQIEILNGRSITPIHNKISLFEIHGRPVHSNISADNQVFFYPWIDNEPGPAIPMPFHELHRDIINIKGFANRLVIEDMRYLHIYEITPDFECIHINSHLSKRSLLAITANTIITNPADHMIIIYDMEFNILNQIKYEKMPYRIMYDDGYLYLVLGRTINACKPSTDKVMKSGHLIQHIDISTNQSQLHEYNETHII